MPTSPTAYDLGLELGHLTKQAQGGEFFGGLKKFWGGFTPEQQRGMIGGGLGLLGGTLLGGQQAGLMGGLAGAGLGYYAPKLFPDMFRPGQAMTTEQAPEQRQPIQAPGQRQPMPVPEQQQPSPSEVQLATGEPAPPAAAPVPAPAVDPAAAEAARQEQLMLSQGQPAEQVMADRAREEARQRQEWLSRPAPPEEQLSLDPAEGNLRQRLEAETAVRQEAARAADKGPDTNTTGEPVSTEEARKPISERPDLSVLDKVSAGQTVDPGTLNIQHFTSAGQQPGTGVVTYQSDVDGDWYAETQKWGRLRVGEVLLDPETYEPTAAADFEFLDIVPTGRVRNVSIPIMAPAPSTSMWYPGKGKWYDPRHLTGLPSLEEANKVLTPKPRGETVEDVFVVGRDRNTNELVTYRAASPNYGGRIDAARGQHVLTGIPDIDKEISRNFQTTTGLWGTREETRPWGYGGKRGWFKANTRRYPAWAPYHPNFVEGMPVSVPPNPQHQVAATRGAYATGLQ